MHRAYADLCCLPLAERGLRLGKPRKVLLAAGIFGAALLLVAFNLLPWRPPWSGRRW